MLITYYSLLDREMQTGSLDPWGPLVSVVVLFCCYQLYQETRDGVRPTT